MPPSVKTPGAITQVSRQPYPPVPQKLACMPIQAQVEGFFLLLRRLAAHPDLIAHGQRTAGYAALLAKAAGLHAADVMDLHHAALLHDIGKLTLSEKLLNKQEPLTSDEYALLQSHPRAGAELLSDISFLRRPAVWIAHHHERWDGTGYPYGLRDSFIPLGSRILAVADTFDALASGQPAHTGLSALHVLRILAGSQLDPALVEIFLGHYQSRQE